jgi:glutamine amidotransferase
MIGIVDYGRGNLRSVQKAFHSLGMDAVVSSDPHILKQSRGLVLPGVGAYDDAMGALRRSGLDTLIIERIGAGLPFLGICLGFQVLFETSEEGGEEPGLGILAGTVKRFPEGELKVPHMGWNSIILKKESSRMRLENDGAYFYFVHSYYVEPRDPSIVLAETEYGLPFAAGVEVDNLLAFQFHPEKSSRAGLSILCDFATRSGERAG